ncbi:hypothetical protein, partial [Klebsiella pneumoniae]|uniref:hypothetical protein n=1 Tax=Klebsiella pneumoniae TaxID=573 RepID=UPI0035101DC7
FLRTAVNDFMDSVHHIWCPLSSQEFQDLPDGAETTLTGIYHRPGNKLAVCSSSGGKTGIKFSGGGSGDIPVIYS